MDEIEQQETAAHTPGPWGCVRYGGPAEFEITARHKKLAIVNQRQRVQEKIGGPVHFEDGPFTEAEALANARLIAAAPALLAALKEASAYALAVNTAIATGQPVPLLQGPAEGQWGDNGEFGRWDAAIAQARGQS